MNDTFNYRYILISYTLKISVVIQIACFGLYVLHIWFFPVEAILVHVKRPPFPIEIFYGHKLTCNAWTIHGISQRFCIAFSILRQCIQSTL